MVIAWAHLLSQCSSILKWQLWLLGSHLVILPEPSPGCYLIIPTLPAEGTQHRGWLLLCPRLRLSPSQMQGQRPHFPPPLRQVGVVRGGTWTRRVFLIHGPRASLASRKPLKTYGHLDCGDLAFVVSLGRRWTWEVEKELSDYPKLPLGLG